MTEQSVFDTFDPSTLVYLSPDSPHVLTDLDERFVYVIGGIVDRTVVKVGMCAGRAACRSAGARVTSRCACSQNMSYDRAVAHGARTARLPIQENLPVRLNHVLNINTVLRILILFAQSRDWKHAIVDAVPARKQRSSNQPRSALPPEPRTKAELADLMARAPHVIRYFSFRTRLLQLLEHAKQPRVRVTSAPKDRSGLLFGAVAEVTLKDGLVVCAVGEGKQKRLAEGVACARLTMKLRELGVVGDELAATSSGASDM